MLNKNILIIGLSISNVSVLRYVNRYEPKKVIITDSSALNKEELSATAKSIYPEVELILGTHENIELNNVDIIIKNSSIPDRMPLLQQAIQLNIPIETDVSLFFKEIDNDKLIGVTGTKGKSTTSTFLHKVLSEQGLSVNLVGNVGIPVFDLFDEIQKSDFTVVEISSYMCKSLSQHNLSPKYGIVTSISVDHTDFHGDEAKYISDKLSLFKNQKYGSLTIVSNQAKKYLPLISNGVNTVKVVETNIVKTPKNKYWGEHYLSNFSSVYMLTKEIVGNSFSEANFEKTLKNFDGIKARMEFRGESENIVFINNSKATDPFAFTTDLISLKDKQKDVYIICGGEDKNLPLNDMSNSINLPFIKKVALINPEGSKNLKVTIEPDKVIGEYTCMETAFNELVTHVEKSNNHNNLLILMPGIGTYGVFRNDHGLAVFNQCVSNYLEKY